MRKFYIQTETSAKILRCQKVIIAQTNTQYSVNDSTLMHPFLIVISQTLMSSNCSLDCLNRSPEL